MQHWANLNFEIMKKKHKGDLLSFILKSIEFKSGSNLFFTISRLTENEIIDIKKILEIDCTGFEHTIDDAAVRHAISKHGKDEKPVDIADFLLIPEIVSKYDKLQVGKKVNGLDRLMYQKKFGNNLVLVEYVTEIRKGRKSLSMVTMYKK